MGAVRSRAMSGVKRANEAPAIMQSPNHRGKLKSRANQGNWPTCAMQIMYIYDIEIFLLKKFSELMIEVIVPD
jgi:hypothetical protein